MQTGKNSLMLIAAASLLTGCASSTGWFAKGQNTRDVTASVEVQVPTDEVMRAKPRPERITAATETLRPTERPEQNLGTTIAALGLLDRDGLWLRTPLVTSEAAGRVVYRKLGNSANVLLLPLDGDTGAGSQLSLAAMQVLGIPLTDLVELQVFVR